MRRALAHKLCPRGCPPGYRARIEGRLQDPARWTIGLRTARAEGAAVVAALEKLRRECPELPPIPVHVLAAGGVKTTSAHRVHDAWKATAARAAAARYTDVPASGHMPFDAPEAVVGAILGVLTAVEIAALDGSRANTVDHL